MSLLYDYDQATWMHRFSRRNMLLAGLWYSKEKPTMNTFLLPLIEELNQLYEEGECKNYTHVYYIVFNLSFIQESQ